MLPVINLSFESGRNAAKTGIMAENTADADFIVQITRGDFFLQLQTNSRAEAITNLD